MSDTSEAVVAPEAGPSDTGMTLTLNDIQNAVKVIDFAAEQGAFKGWGTIEQVLIVRNRLNAFLGAASEASGDAEAPAEAEASAT